MRALIISDIHANLEAFHAILADAETRGPIDEIWCLGDIVGYGPDPGPVIELLRQHDHAAIAGNHDWAAIGRIDTEDFNPYARAAALWTRDNLSQEHVEYLESLPLTLVKEDFTLAHGSPRDPIWEYMVTETAALASVERLESRHGLVGHSHLPFLCRVEAHEMRCDYIEFPVDTPVALDDGTLFINPGGAGQPRDRDPRTTYVLFDSGQGAVTRFRVPYDIPATQEKMWQAGLPEPLIERLERGV